jgi:hypothetical protein
MMTYLLDGPDIYSAESSNFPANAKWNIVFAFHVVPVFVFEKTMLDS